MFFMFLFKYKTCFYDFYSKIYAFDNYVWAQVTWISVSKLHGRICWPDTHVLCNIIGESRDWQITSLSTFSPLLRLDTISLCAGGDLHRPTLLGPGCQPKVGILDLLLAMFMVCLSDVRCPSDVCWSRRWIVAKRLDRSRCRLACGAGWATVTMY